MALAGTVLKQVPNIRGPPSLRHFLLLIEGYRRDLTRLRELSRYAKGLEEENLILQKKLENEGAWKVEHPDKEALIKKLDWEIRNLKGILTKGFPKRVIELKHIKQKMRNMSDYVLYLRSQLDANGISYEERKPNPSPKVEDLNIENIDIFAVRGPNENFEVEEQYCYKYPRPALTADCIVFTKEATPRVLLIERGDEPYKGSWAFPGGFMNMDETTEQCAIRELEEETGMRIDHVQQIGTYSKVDRDPRDRTITVAYLSVMDAPCEVSGQDDAAKAQWFYINDLPNLAFDHDEIMRDAMAVFKESLCVDG